jgi:hypothetical protein
MSWAIQLVIALAIFTAGAAGGVKWHAGQDAIAAQAAAEAVKSDQILQRKFNDKAAGTHAAELATINNQLGNAREQIANLSGRECFDADTAGMLSAVGAEPGRTASGQPESTPATAAAGTGFRYSTDRDAAGYIALCRARYAEVESQLNKIMDIEDLRHPPP